MFMSSYLLLFFCISRGRCVSGTVVYGSQAKSPLSAPVVHMCRWREMRSCNYIPAVGSSLVSLVDVDAGLRTALRAVVFWPFGPSGLVGPVFVLTLPVSVGTLLGAGQVNSVIRSSRYFIYLCVILV